MEFCTKSQALITGASLLLSVMRLGVAAEQWPPPKPVIHCSTSDACLKLMAVHRRLGNVWLTDYDQALAEKTVTFGPMVIPSLVALLKSKNEVVADRAAYALDKFDKIPSKYLPNLVAADFGSNTDAAMVIGKMGTPEAADALIENMRTNDYGGGPQRMSAWDAYGLELFGPGIWPKLVEALKCKQGCSDSLLSGISDAFSRYDAKPVEAVAPLAAIAADNTYPTRVRKAAIYSLSEFGRLAADAAPSLLKAREEHVPELERPLSWALTQIGDPAAVAVLIDELKQPKLDEDMSRGEILMSIASFGSQGVSAGPSVMEFLTSDDWSLRVQAAFTLGEIGYAPAVPRLVEVLTGPDWRLSYEAARTLGKIGSAEAAPKLALAANQHWSRAVRAEAKGALDAINGHTPMIESLDEYRGARYITMAPPHAQYAGGCKSKRVMWGGKVIEVKDVKTWPVPDKDRKLGFSLPGYATGVYPVQDGWLVGKDDGEFGGELYYYGNGAEPVTLIEDNTRGIYQTSNGLVAVGGLAHMVGDYGWVFSIVHDGGGHWRVTPLLILPGAPEDTMVLDDGTLIVLTYPIPVAITGGAHIQEIECVTD